MHPMGSFTGKKYKVFFAEQRRFSNHWQPGMARNDDTASLDESPKDR